MRQVAGPACRTRSSPFATVWVSGAPLAVASRGDIERLICEGTNVGGRVGGWVVTATLEHLRQISVNNDVAALIGRADVVVADGMPLVWAATVLGEPLRGRVAGSDLIWGVARRGAERGLRLYLLGGRPEAAKQAGKTLAEAFPGLRICGAWGPAVSGIPSEAEIDAVLSRLVAAEPDVVFVGMGFPKQDYLIDAVRGDLPGAWFVGCGVSLEFVAGIVPRAPAWAQALGIEWLHRLIHEPKRLFARYVVRGLPFALRLAVCVIRERQRAI